MEQNEIGSKYRILDAATGEEKKGKYFCLRIDANNPEERIIVRATLKKYAELHGGPSSEYAKNVLKFIGEGECLCDLE